VENAESNRTNVPSNFTVPADGEIFPQPEPDTPRVRTVSNTPDAEGHDEPVTPVPRRATGANELEANQDGAEPPTAGGAAADLRMEQRLLAHMQQVTAGTPLNNLTAAAGTAHGTSTPLLLRAEPNSHALVPFDSSSSETDSLPELLRHLFANTGIDAKTILDIAHNRFKALNLYRLLSTEGEQTVTQVEATPEPAQQLGGASATTTAEVTVHAALLTSMVNAMNTLTARLGLDTAPGPQGAQAQAQAPQGTAQSLVVVPLGNG
jgi:hypothetical protein